MAVTRLSVPGWRIHYLVIQGTHTSGQKSKLCDQKHFKFLIFTISLFMFFFINSNKLISIDTYSVKFKCHLTNLILLRECRKLTELLLIENMTIEQWVQPL